MRLSCLDSRLAASRLPPGCEHTLQLMSGIEALQFQRLNKDPARSLAHSHLDMSRFCSTEQRPACRSLLTYSPCPGFRRIRPLCFARTNNSDGLEISPAPRRGTKRTLGPVRARLITSASTCTVPRAAEPARLIGPWSPLIKDTYNTHESPGRRWYP